MRLAYSAPLLSFAVVLLSYAFYPFYLDGDQVFYRQFYEMLPSKGLLDGFAMYGEMLGTVEPVYFLLTFIFSSWLDKDLLFSLLNGVMFYCLCLWLSRLRVSLVLLPLLLTNFYLLVVFFAAERLKVSIMFFMLAGVVVGMKRPLFYFFSILSHLQITIPVVVVRLLGLNYQFNRLLQGYLKTSMSLFFVFLLLLACLAIPFYTHLVNKLTFYMNDSGGLVEALKPLAFMALTLFYARGRVVVFLACSLLVACCVLLGSSRLVIFSYFLFMYYALQVKRGLNFGVVLTSGYFSVKGILFLKNVIYCGEGFDCVALT